MKIKRFLEPEVIVIVSRFVKRLIMQDMKSSMRKISYPHQTLWGAYNANICSSRTWLSYTQIKKTGVLWDQILKNKYAVSYGKMSRKPVNVIYLPLGTKITASLIKDAKNRTTEGEFWRKFWDRYCILFLISDVKGREYSKHESFQCLTPRYQVCVSILVRRCLISFRNFCS